MSRCMHCTAVRCFYCFSFVKELQDFVKSSGWTLSSVSNWAEMLRKLTTWKKLVLETKQWAKLEHLSGSWGLRFNAFCWSRRPFGTFLIIDEILRRKFVSQGQTTCESRFLYRYCATYTGRCAAKKFLEMVHWRFVLSTTNFGQKPHNSCPRPYVLLYDFMFLQNSS